MRGCLFGNGQIIDNELEVKLRNQLIYAIEVKKIYEFWSGGIGQFDTLVAYVLKDLKKEYPQIKSYLILAYLKEKTDKEWEEYVNDLYDGTLYPDLETVPKKVAIAKRNEIMIKESDYFILYVDYISANARSIMDKVKKAKKKYINLGRIK